MAGSVRVSVTVNGAQESADVEPRLLLVHFLRETLGLTGTHVGCDTSNCGACTVHLNGEAVKSCTLLAVQADGAEIKTIEGMGQEGALHPLQEAFWEHHGLQCGYCTPGMIMASADLLQRNPNPNEEEVREALAGNLCRCTGYHNIVKAVLRGLERHERHGGRALGRPADQAQGGPAADHGPRPLRRRHQRHRAAVGVVRPLARGAREDHLDRHVGREGAIPACTPSSPATTSTSRRRCRWPGCRRASRSTTRRTGRSPRTRSTTSATRSRSSSARTATRWSTPPSRCSSSTTRCRSSPTSRRRSRTAPTSSTRSSAPTSATSGRWAAATSRPASRPADVIVERRVVNHRIAGAAIEPRGVLADYRAGSLTLTSSTQVPHFLRLFLALQLGISEERVRVIAPEVGGGFGSKLQIYGEEIVARVGVAQARAADQVDRDALGGHAWSPITGATRSRT